LFNITEVDRLSAGPHLVFRDAAGPRSSPAECFTFLIISTFLKNFSKIKKISLTRHFSGCIN
jgi:hypothetical protein